MASFELPGETGKLSADQLRFGYWYVSHKLIIRRIALIILALLDFILIIGSLYVIFDHYVLKSTERQNFAIAIAEPKMNYQYINELATPQALNVTTTKVLALGDGKYDLLAIVENPNLTWQVSLVKYHFETPDFKSNTYSDYILPLQQKFLMVLAVSHSAVLDNVNLVIDEIKWNKINNYEKLRDKVFNIEILEPKFVAPSESGVSDQINVSRVSFIAFNNSAYNWWDVNFKVVLMRGDDIVAINNVPVHDLRAGEKRLSEYYIYNLSSLPNKILVFPEVNILDPASYKGFDGEGEFK